MRLLLDTHVWIWSIDAPRRLSRRVAALLSSPRSELWLSAATVWEVMLLAQKGRVRLGQPVDVWSDNALAERPIRDAPNTREVARECRRLEIDTEDPSDRFIAATARVYDLTLVTSDERLLALRGIATVSNR